MNFKFEKGFSSTGEVNVATTGSTADDVVMKGGVMSLQKMLFVFVQGNMNSICNVTFGCFFNHLFNCIC